MQFTEETPTPPPASASAGEPAGAEGDGGKSPASPCVENERQIPVDPVSLRHLGMVAETDSPLSLPSVLTEVVARSSPLLPPLRRPTFVWASLPCSAASSPVHGADRHGTGPTLAAASLARQHSAAAGPVLSRNASRAEGRTMARHDDDEPAAAAKRDDRHGTGPTLAAAPASSLARQHSVALAHYVVAPAGPVLSRNASRAEGRTMARHDDDEPAAADDDDGFKCCALCMFIPGFSKKKPAAAAVVSSIQRQQSGLRRRSSVSRVASLERFECGSWSPPPPPPPPAADVALDVAKAAFAFAFDGEPEPRGILKKSASVSASASQRHVRFSTAAASLPSSPCVTPRLAKVRAEFNAFLEAQV